MLARHGGTPIRVFAIWERIQPLDIGPPGRWALHTMSDDPFVEKRFVCVFRAVCMRARMQSVGSPTLSPLSFS